MNDYWNDPPEQPEPPYCSDCEEYFEVAKDGLSATCPKCQKVWKAQPDPEPHYEEQPWTEESERMVNFPAKCPHGNDWFDCDSCNFLSDLRYAADREKRHL